MNRREALKYITLKINEGESKSVIYKELLHRIPYKSDLLSYMAEIPDLQAMKQIKPINTALIAILILLVILQSIEAVLIFHGAESIHIPWLVLGGWFYFIFPILFIFVIADVWKFRRRGYQSIIPYTVLMLTQAINDNGAYITWSYLYIPWLVSITLTVLILRKAFPYNRLFRKLDQNKLEAALKQ